MEENLPVIQLELSSGTFKIKTQDAVYQITVTADSSLAKVVEKVIEREAAPKPTTPITGASGQDLFYRDLTEEMYKEIGRLARQLSLSIKEIPGQSIKGVDIEQTGIELEDAKGQLEDIVQMTEKATMDIMDLAETIQEDLQNVDGALGSLKNLDFMAMADEPDLDWGDDEADMAAEKTPAPATPVVSTEFLDGMINNVESLKEAVSGLPRFNGDAASAPVEPKAPQPAPEAVSQIVTTYSFDLDVVFQTLYELCTNETVKDHIKAMRADQAAAFDNNQVLKSLADMAPTVEKEDDFFNFSIADVLKSLFVSCKVDKYKQVLKKMNQTSGNIFLDAILPIEGEVKEEETTVQPAAAPQPEPAAPAELKPGLEEDQIQTLLSIVDENLTALLNEKERIEQAGEDPGTGMEPDLGPDFTRVKTDDRKKIINMIEASSTTVDRIMQHLTRILEALSFQDLSGQRILKIVRLISDVQVQLLSLLVSFGAKLKHSQKEEVGEQITREETAKMAQDEVDKMLEKVTGPSELAGPDAEGRLDQDMVNKMLEDMGF